MSIAFKTEKDYDEHTLKISYLGISKSDKSLKLCPEIVSEEFQKTIAWFYTEM